MSVGNDNPVISGAATPLNMGLGEPGFDRYGPIIDAQRVKDEYLFGIPLKAALTGQELTDDIIKQIIRKAIGDFETTVRVAVNPVRITDQMDFIRADDGQFGTKKVTRYPVLKVENLKALWPGRNDILSQFGSSQEIDYPTSWVSLLGDQGLIRVIPNSGTLVNADVNFLASSAYRSVVLGGLKSWPNMWRITYIAGMNPDQVPDIVNDCIGTMAAIRLLGQLGPAIFPLASHGIGIDGLSQSVATAGPQWLAGRLQELIAERDRAVDALKGYYGTDISFGAW